MRGMRIARKFLLNSGVCAYLQVNLRAERLGLRSFSEYVSALILADLEAPDEPFVIYPRKLKKGTAPAGSRTPSPRQGRSVGG